VARAHAPLQPQLRWQLRPPLGFRMRRTPLSGLRAGEAIALPPRQQKRARQI